jgi:hypothetical protein
MAPGTIASRASDSPESLQAFQVRKWVPEQFHEPCSLRCTHRSFVRTFVALGAWCFYTSLAGKPLWKDKLFE